MRWNGDVPLIFLAAAALPLAAQTRPRASAGEDLQARMEAFPREILGDTSAALAGVPSPPWRLVGGAER